MINSSIMIPILFLITIKSHIIKYLQWSSSIKLLNLTLVTHQSFISSSLLNKYIYKLALKLQNILIQQMSLTQESVNNYNKMKSDYAEYFKKFIELEDSRREHKLVLTNIQGLSKQRRCWRMVGGVLVEKTMEEITKSLNDNVGMLDQTCKALQTSMSTKQKEILQFETKYNVNPNKKQETKQEKPEAADKGPGLLI